MKKMLMLVLAVATLSLQAKSLEDYDASRRYDVKWPVIGFNGAQVAVKNVCVEGDELKTINAVKVCAETAVVEVCKRHKDDEVCSPVRAGRTYRSDSRTRLVYGCVRHESVDLVRSRTYEASECAKWKRNYIGKRDHSDQAQWSCVEYKKVTREIPTSYSVEVFATFGKDHNDVVVATKNYDLANCQ